MNDPTRIDAFAQVIRILERNLRYLESIGLEPATIEAYKKTISYLKRQTKEGIENIVGSRRGASTRVKRSMDPEMSDQELSVLPGDQVEALLSLPKLSRKFLERLATVRFGVSPGALSSLRSRNALVDKLHTLVSHERTHDAISRTTARTPR
ncbi:MAG: hypothetical protein F4010_05015 [Cenarchaeum sp. SB0669_bin_11]|nr:hypothetical protein [Acidobacteriota bacterium]MYH21859.1 hypothetical protein [Acidobacteriota bacterium]MYL11496.1 hypothetical protein [Cenarchaeum sp. SB0669_bin_11]